ncbi:hypothetical protein Y1Q_0011210 [Alligator mississippiensis]|uniref:Uncharacterized protein n=1 Tax=Alligator mississippiensis TaxID=8496 RepID=A0A151P8S3_ALLMI|nr:hypothetical protein Y1Q_0011210 [Alligator mississippiensis]
MVCSRQKDRGRTGEANAVSGGGSCYRLYGPVRTTVRLRWRKEQGRKQQPGAEASLNPSVQQHDMLRKQLGTGSQHCNLLPIRLCIRSNQIDILERACRLHQAHIAGIIVSCYEDWWRGSRGSETRQWGCRHPACPQAIVRTFAMT